MRAPSVLLICVAFCQIVDKTKSQQCPAFGSEESILGWMLQGHIYQTMMANIGLHCLSVCLKDDRCQSFNFVMSLHMCEFSDRTKEARPEDFIPDADRYYFRKYINRVPLGSISDLAAESCKEIKMSEGRSPNGKYWMSSIKPGIPVLAFCDMKTEDVNECTASSPVCHVNATCNNSLGSYRCTCKPGYAGDGKTCKDINECNTSSPVCHINASCYNTLGSYHCTCKPGYTGSGKSCSGFSNITTNGAKGRFGIIQQFTVPRNGRYMIKACGARGGTHSYNYGDSPGIYYGGKGALKEGTFTLNKGTVLNIVVGQRGGDSVEVKGGQSTNMTAAELGLSVEDNAGTGGGGGSFVYTISNVLLLAAGGGGGASGGYNGSDGQLGNNGSSSVGKESSNSRMGGTRGQPGQCNSAGASHHGGVGAGWLAQGCARASNSHGERGGSRAQDWVGGRAGAMNSGYNGGPIPGAVGGFGGGGGGSEDNGASGGGGGYSGGGSGTHPKQAGGGGGSYCRGWNCSGASGGNLNDDGLVQIFELS
ncbi:uncharacterized transmembrane protein DDB_G0289901-like [Montipora foliosa]|uniref:uncharacterized transmembrane protein DDB_G0289901-like n=1 Tax=Montipora foliosa TaxID=591990 RepID=UPI0035F145A7